MSCGESGRRSNRIVLKDACIFELKRPEALTPFSQARLYTKGWPNIELDYRWF
jgi:hypothetical protein